MAAAPGAPPSRYLILLLGKDGYKVYSAGTSIDVFRGKAAVTKQEDEKYPTQLSKHIKVLKHCITFLILLIQNRRAHWK
jgi:hypothetical protein